jgi:hypothetical protein
MSPPSVHIDRAKWVSLKPLCLCAGMKAEGTSRPRVSRRLIAREKWRIGRSAATTTRRRRDRLNGQPQEREGPAEALNLTFAGRIQRGLKLDVEGAGTDAAPVHRAQHLDIADGIEPEAAPNAGFQRPRVRLLRSTCRALQKARRPFLTRCRSTRSCSAFPAAATDWKLLGAALA